ncbi:Alpha/Beta hydrolase protein [Mycena crocata]|nr:Alpha/Beta hydrolase protein [Mycena crocata]
MAALNPWVPEYSYLPMLPAVLFFLVWVGAVAYAQSPSESETKIVDLGYATYQSHLSLAAGVTSFLGIRYAASSAGDQRWRAPRVPGKIHAVKNATTPPSQCLHIPLMGSPGRSTTSTFENPLSTAHWEFRTHSLRAKENSLLPVIVYIHASLFFGGRYTGFLTYPLQGGGYDAGSATVYPVHDFVTLSDFGVIAVAVQYRLGVFGFLSGQKVKDAGDLNVGLRFCSTMGSKTSLPNNLKISSFGGDPARVTIWGQSAGAGAMLQHVVAHGGNTQPPLFRAVIANSPILNSQYQFNDLIPEALYSAVASEAGCCASGDSMKCLRDADASTLLAAGTQIGISGFLGLFSFVPVIDGKFIVERPSVTLKRGNLNGHYSSALLTTSRRDAGPADGRFAVPPTVEDSAFLDAFRQSFMSTAIFMDPNIRIHTSILPVWTPWGENHTEMKFGQSKEGPFIQVFNSDPDLLERCGVSRPSIPNESVLDNVVVSVAKVIAENTVAFVIFVSNSQGQATFTFDCELDMDDPLFDADRFEFSEGFAGDSTESDSDEESTSDSEANFLEDESSESNNGDGY